MIKYKTRLIIRDDLQSIHIKIDDQNVYAIILTFKIFKTLMILITTFNFKIKQLNAINVFFNFDYMRKYIIICRKIVKYMTKC